jgi:hypothetical protein
MILANEPLTKHDTKKDMSQSPVAKLAHLPISGTKRLLLTPRR